MSCDDTRTPHSHRYQDPTLSSYSMHLQDARSEVRMSMYNATTVQRVTVSSLNHSGTAGQLHWALLAMLGRILELSGTVPCCAWRWNCGGAHARTIKIGTSLRLPRIVFDYSVISERSRTLIGRCLPRMGLLGKRALRALARVRISQYVASRAFAFG